ncbi:hypothetical protein [uncultured Pseudoalteromonas sp.]|uniref:hypothetical protein n=1 Tax=uncultured Pseudoalteromonas sp. TaxID=114053 RepID=UPI002596E761|nr:hypothetical protein [uncultured Pseudoalteromonas sp.]
MSDVNRLNKLVDEALKIQVAAMLNIHFMCNESMALAKSIWHLTDLDAEAIRDADIMTLQNVAHHHGILNCASMPSGTIKQLIECQTDGPHSHVNATYMSVRR